MDKEGYKTHIAGLIEESSEMKDGIEDAIKILGMYDRNCKISMGMAMNNSKKILRRVLQKPSDSNQMSLFDDKDA